MYDPCKHCGKTNHLERNCFKEKRLMAKAKKKTSHDSQIALCAYVVLPNNSSSNVDSSNVEWIMDSGAFKHMTGNASLFTSYDNRKHISQKVSIGDGKQLSVIGSGNVNVTNGQLEDVFHVEHMPINLLSIYHACQKGFKFEAWPDKYVLKDINQNFKVVSSGPVDHTTGLYKFAGFNSTKRQSFYSYVSHADEKSKLWHERLGHLNYGKMQLLTKMVHGLPHISSTNGVCEGCVLGKHHREMFEKGKAWHAKEPLQLIHSDICGPLEVPSLSYAIYFLTFIDDFNRKSWVYFFKHKSETFFKFQLFKSLVENKSGKNIKTLRTDNWGEFIKK